MTQREKIEEIATKKYICTKCLLTKNADDFWKRETARGLHSWCKGCMRYDGQRRYAENPDKKAKQVVAYRKTRQGRAALSTASKNRAQKRPEAVRAVQAVNNAVAWGKLVKPPQCSKCNSSTNGRIEGHHPDYSKPLDVIWLCVLCHKDIHGVSLRTKKNGLAHQDGGSLQAPV